jgi:hypothetical protein
MMFGLQVLPVEILIIILNHHDLNGWGGILRLVCKRWNLIVKSPKIYLPNVYLTFTLYKHATGVYVDKEWNERNIIKNAAKVGSIGMINWARSMGQTFNTWTCMYAAENGQLECLVYLHENGCPWDRRSACKYAAHNGRLGCLQYLHENGCPWDEHACEEAAGGGHLGCLEYLHKSGCHWDEYACEEAAYNGQLDCLKYLHENGCPWDKDACTWAAGGGHLGCLKYLHENGCPWDESACRDAAQFGHVECLKYLHKNGCPWDKQGCIRVANLYKNSACYDYIKDA